MASSSARTSIQFAGPLSHYRVSSLSKLRKETNRATDPSRPAGHRQIQAAEPGLGFNSAITKERKPSEHGQLQTRRSGFMALCPFRQTHCMNSVARFAWGIVVTVWGHAAQPIRQRKGPPIRTVVFLRGSAVKLGPRSSFMTWQRASRKRLQDRRLLTSVGRRLAAPTKNQAKRILRRALRFGAAATSVRKETQKPRYRPPAGSPIAG